MVRQATKSKERLIAFFVKKKRRNPHHGVGFQRQILRKGDKNDTRKIWQTGGQKRQADALFSKNFPKTVTFFAYLLILTKLWHLAVIDKSHTCVIYLS